MIITRLVGGLGNQLFQYAVARRLAEGAGTLKIDISGLENSDYDHKHPLWKHKYSLWPFNIQENFASLEEVGALTKRGIAERLVDRIFRRRRCWLFSTHIREITGSGFSPDILNPGTDNVYLDGYWQSERYFTDIEDIIRHEFRIKTPQKGKDKELAEQITSCESVSLHVRWGYRVTDKDGLFATCSYLHYYSPCIERITQAVRNPHFFVFSDNPQWARETIKLSYPVTFVDHNGRDKNYEDLRLMSQCKNHIISNSSFSWWGAWLDPRKDKIVLAPRRWFTDKKKHNTEDLIPNEWIKI